MHQSRWLCSILFCFVLMLIADMPPLLGQIEGRARVVDGDSLDVAQRRIHLDGIDAPELKQRCRNDRGQFYPCGEQAKAYLESLIRGNILRCIALADDPIRGAAGRCTVKGIDLGRQMIAAGYATLRGQNGRLYVKELQAARRAKRGMWQGEFVLPFFWRRGFTVPPRTFEGSATCLIKGSIDSRGKKRYYTPHDPDYARVRVFGPNERWFCSLAEAIKMGFRDPGPQCRVKAVIGADGRRVYYLPGDQRYEQTRISFRRGGRWFCSQGQAYQHGFRRCLIKGIKASNQFFIQRSRGYKEKKVIPEQGDRWFCNVRNALQAGFNPPSRR